MGSGRLFFDPSKARGPRQGPDVGEDVTGRFASPRAQDSGQGGEKADGPEAMTVAGLVGRIKSALTEAFPAEVRVVGEVSNFKRHSSGHLYFRLKDAESAIDAVMFRRSAQRLKFQCQDGLEVFAEGRVDVYDSQGRLQLYVERMTPKGAGALELAFRQLREKLEKEGLFDPAAKKPIPRFPRGIGVVTSPTGAAIRDIRRTLRRRWCGARVFLAPVRVQGDAAAGEIVKALEALDASAKALEIDTILLARGGGSLEDLWSFNEEAVARAVYKMQTPVICGVGHEVDVTIAELVADRRAATPTAAAELAVPDAMQVRDGLDELAGRLRRALTGDLDRARACLEAVLRSVIFRDPTWRVRSASQRLDELTHRLTAGMGQKLAGSGRRLEPTARRLAAQHPALQAQRARSRLDHAVNKLAWVLGARAKREGDRLGGLEGRLGAVHPKGAIRLARQQLQAAERQLEALSYRSVLKRGFSVTRLEGGTLVRSADQVEPGAVLETQLADGSVRSTAEGGGEKPKPDKPVPAAKPPTRKKPGEPGQGKLF